MACIDVNINFCYSVKCCPAKGVLFTPQINNNKLVTMIKWVAEVNLPNAVIVICELFVVESKLIHKISSHLLDLVV